MDSLLYMNRTFKVVIALFILLFSFMVYADNESSDYELRYRQAGHPATSAVAFESLSRDNDASIRKRVASNRKTPKSILFRLAKDTDQSVKIALATNLSAADNVYPILARDKMVAVRSVVARFEYVPVSALEILSKDKNVDIRIEVARNLNSTKEILTNLLNDTDSLVKAIAEQALQRLNDESL